MAESKKRTTQEAILEVQKKLIVPKSRQNKFGGFAYRSIEDITAALKEPCCDAGLVYYMSDSPVMVGERIYVCATVTAELADGSGERIMVTGYARETQVKKGMDESQITGMASSYARKYALCGMFDIDGQSDADGTEPSAERPEKSVPKSGTFTAKCFHCGKRYEFASKEQFDGFLAKPNCCASPDWHVE